jgi:uncharacterized protein
MLLDLNKLQGHREHVERSLPAAAFEPQDEDYRVVAAAELWMDVQKAGADVFRLTGRMATTLELDCCRCVEAFAVPVDASFDLRYVPQTANKGEGEREIAEDDLATAYHREGVLDLVELVREQIQLALPMKPLHDEACRGLCPECGANLNRIDCGHSPKWEDPRLAALKGLLTTDRDKE